MNKFEIDAVIRGLDHKEYLGDGLYCGFDGYQVWLWASNGEEVISGPVALEPSVFQNLNNYWKRVTGNEAP